MLRIEGLDSGYDKSLCVMDVSMEIETGERVCLLGRNGVGKTTLLKTIMGILPPRSGHCFINKRNTTGLAPYEIARMGIGYVPQGRGIFGAFSVEDNLRMGTIAQRGRVGEIDDDVLDYFPVLRERLEQKAGTLSGGEQQMLSIARVLAGKPRLLLLDEPSEGLQPSIVGHLREIIRKISVDHELAILLVEQNLDFALDTTRRGYVMEKGRIVEEGTVDILRNDKIVQEYLGV
jgi:urea ABC transporter ATP-binding protein UrtE